MSNMQDKENKGVKKRLGRGLGSLLGENSPNYLEEVEVPDLEKAHRMNKSKPDQVMKNSLRQEAIKKNPQIKTTPGISAKQPIESPPASVIDSNRVWQIEIAKIFANKKQPRKHFDSEKINELANSIREKGIIQPILVRKKADKQYEIIAGERRWRAAQKAGLHQVPAIIKEYSVQDTLEIALIENIQRQDLNPIEEAEAYQQLMVDYSLTQQQLADKMGKERATLANKIRLLNLTEKVRDSIKKGDLSVGIAKLLLALDDSKKQEQAAREIINLQMTVKQAEKLIKNIKTEPKELSQQEQIQQTKIAMARKVEEELKKLLGTKVSVDYNDKGKGKIAIQFYSELEFNSIIDGLRRAWQK